MQESFGFATADIDYCRTRLTLFLGPLADGPRRTPLWQMVRSMLGAQTYDAVAEAALARLACRWPTPALLAAASAIDIETTIHDVTYADRKAAQLAETLRLIALERPDFDLEWLGRLAVAEALAWLERLPGVGRKVAAATLNASTLRRPVFIVDCHVHRVMQRFGLIGGKASPEAGSRLVTENAEGFGADDFYDLFRRMKLLGQTICRFDAPDCAACPLSARCRTARRAAASSLPSPQRRLGFKQTQHGFQLSL